MSKKYVPSSMIPMKFKGYDVLIKTDEEGNAILLFIGKADDEGRIKGERFARRLIKDKEGKVIKDHWDHKGKIS